MLPSERLLVIPTGRLPTEDIVECLRQESMPALFMLPPTWPPKESWRPPLDALSEDNLVMAVESLGPELSEAGQYTAKPHLLKQVAWVEQTLEECRAGLIDATRLGHTLTASSAWLLDNTHVFESHFAEVRANLPKHYTRILPALLSQPEHLRIYHLAIEIVRHTGCIITEEKLVASLAAFQKSYPLDIAELWAFPLMLRLALLEELARLAVGVGHDQDLREASYFWGNRLVAAGRTSPAALDRFLVELSEQPYASSCHFLAFLGEQLMGDDDALGPVQRWAEERAEETLAELVRREQHHEASDRVSIANDVTSLRELSRIDFKLVFEAVSPVEAILRGDPSGIHAKQDFHTRDRCRRAVEEVSRHSRRSQLEVARQTVELAANATMAYQRQTAYYLIAEGRPELEQRLGNGTPLRLRVLRDLQHHPTATYLTLVIGLTWVFATVAFLLAWENGVRGEARLAIFTLLALFPLSELALQIVNALLIALLPPTRLPRLSCEDGIPIEHSTLVVVPMMLSSEAVVQSEIEKLEIRFLANPEANVYFSLFSDFTDAPLNTMAGDGLLLATARGGIEILNERHGARFLHFHRPRTWSETEQGWIGRERKRGKIEELNEFLCGGANSIVSAGTLPVPVAFVITLDADTQLPTGTARKLVGTIAHPLNQVELTADRRHRRRGYTIIQPRVSISLPNATATRFTRVMSDAHGTDPYCQAVSDVYQDLAGEGIFHGKAIYDVRAFHEILGNRFPPATLLSHDLIEGAHVGVAFAGDIELFEGMPLDYASFSQRQHRWIRGDWQIARWMLPQVPAAGGGREANPLPLLDRWRIFDNLRRSLVPATSICFLLFGWLISPAPGVWSLILAVALGVPALAGLADRIIRRLSGEVYGWGGVTEELLHILVLVVFLPHQAWLALDAIGRVFYRKLFSRRLLLQWQTAEMATTAMPRHFSRTLVHTLVISVASLVVVLLLLARGALWPAVLFLGPWAIGPLMMRWLSVPIADRRQRPLSLAQTAFLRRMSRLIWRYFDDLVGPATNWLPPDNSQLALRIEVAQRTSPTNIGLWLTSSLAAVDFGYLTPDEFLTRCGATLDTLQRLERYEGHWLNWYDIQTLEPLAPRYVSTVDSGNLLAALWVLERGLLDLPDLPVPGAACLRGLADTVAVLAELGGRDPSLRQPLSALRHLFRLGARGHEIIGRLGQAAQPVKQLTAAFRWQATSGGEHAYWVAKLDQQVVSWNTAAARYLSWMETLAAPSDEFLRKIHVDAIAVRGRALRSVPSLAMLAAGTEQPVEELLLLAGKGSPPSQSAWLRQLAAEYGQARAAARETVGRCQTLAAQVRQFADGMRMGFLYDSRRRLFGIGCVVGGPVDFSGHYDLLASECRIASIASIAKGDVPLEHWLALGRAYVTASEGQVLLSWTGTMFEYLMPLLFMRSFENSLLEGACRQAVIRQMEYGREQGAPWGISECAYSVVDSHQVYQYHAFGVPTLALKPGVAEDLVVSPYSSFLALSVFPSAATENLERLAGMGLEGPMGLYEAIDFSRENARGGGRGVVIFTYMAHHQGMSLLAIDNALHRGAMQRRFHANPRIKAVESLLYERIPPTRSVLRQQLPERPGETLIADGSVNFRGAQEEGNVPRVHLLGNGRYSLMLTSSGGGYSQWNGSAISRWHADTTLDNWGSYLYLRDTRSGAVWSATHQPVGGDLGTSNARFSPDRAEYTRQALGIETNMEVCVSPRYDAEIRRVTLINRSSRARALDATSYRELALAPPRSDAAHPAFSKMFVETEYLAEANALIAHRRPRSPQAEPIWAAHLLVTPGDGAPVQFETSREKFLGRGRPHASPVALEGDLTGSEGTVLDPIFSLRCSFSLAPRERIELTFVTLAANSRESLVALIEKFRQRDSLNESFEMAWTNAQLELRFLAIPGAATFAFQELAGHLLFPNSRMRPNAARLARNTLGQEDLWAYGISGDLPILTLTLADSRSLSLARETLLAHTFWRLRGLKVDLVILNQEAPSYDQPFRHQLRRLVESHTVHTGIDIPGGVFLRDWHTIPEGHRTLLLAASHATLSGTRGTLAQQLALANDAPPNSPLLQPLASTKTGAAGQLPFLELPYFNGLGGFTADGREYAIYLDQAARTPAPWSNVIASPDFGTVVTESGLGFTWSGNSQANRLTPWHNDPVRDPQSEILYLRDEETGEFWTPTALPIREATAYRARHGQGYTIYEHHAHGIHQELTVFIPNDATVKVCWLRLRNESGRPRRISVTWFAEWVLGSRRDDTQLHVQSSFDAASNALFARNPWNASYATRIAFSTTSPPPESYTADRTQFLGRNASHARPAGMARVRLSGRAEAGLDPAAVLRTPLDFAVGQEREVTCLLGQAGSEMAARAIIARFREPGAVEASLDAVRQAWDQRLQVLEVQTPVLSVDFLLNRWLLYQTLSCRFWGRSGFYQSGGAFGFRDQLQDSMALVYSAPELARQHLLTAAARQFPEGDVQHWWHPDSGVGVRTLCSDDLLWLPYVTAHYIQVTGDAAVLEEEVPFIDAPLLLPGEHECVSHAVVSPMSGRLLDHCERALDKGLTGGAHGLPLFGNGDWNDGMNLVGAEGRGESSWLAWFLIDVIRQFGPWLPATQQTRFREAAERLSAAMESKAWDGDWYLRGFFDSGAKLGANENTEARIDSIPQSWAAISQAGEPVRTRRALEQAQELLVSESDRLIRLFTPPFDHSEPHPGYIMGYPPGLRENGGQYTHAAIWLAMAFARLGDGVNCGLLLDLLNPVEQARDPAAVQRYAIEPYVIAADIYTAAGLVGRGGWSWYTGSAAWLYRVWIEEVLGFRVRGDSFSVEPCVPATWTTYSLTYRRPGVSYRISVRIDANADPTEVTLDGQRQSVSRVPIVLHSGAHQVEVRAARLSPSDDAPSDRRRRQ
ncbi:MAG: cyclic beta 1-2 glucan synthetase [Bryobacteraceae bacterium]|nr:cyclic beta 1-2 glucan synthetase [Bryobacteraceae bacterium]